MMCENNNIIFFHSRSAYGVMLQCWRSKPCERPSARTVYRELETIERELVLIRRHLQRSAASVASSGGANHHIIHQQQQAGCSGRDTPQSPKSFV